MTPSSRRFAEGTGRRGGLPASAVWPSGGSGCFRTSLSVERSTCLPCGSHLFRGVPPGATEGLELQKFSYCVVCFVDVELSSWPILAVGHFCPSWLCPSGGQPSTGGTTCRTRMGGARGLHLVRKRVSLGPTSSSTSWLCSREVGALGDQGWARVRLRPACFSRLRPQTPV